MSDTPDKPSSSGSHEESLADVLASIRALVSAETIARVDGRPGGDVILLTEAMRIDGGGGSDDPDEDAGAAPARATPPAPILDEEALRRMINAIVREELQGELGEEMGRTLRKLVRREIALLLDEAGRGKGQVQN